MKISYQKMRVLLVDNSSFALGTLESHLEPFNFFRVWTASNADEALKVLKDRLVNLVITAWKMRPISGLQLLESIRKMHKPSELPVILVAHQLDEQMRKKAEEAGATEVLTQPLDPKRLKEAVEAALAPFIDEDEEAFLYNMHMARIAEHKGQLDKAEEFYRAALAVRLDEKAQLGLGRVLKSKGDLKGAEEAFVAALKANPLSLKAFLGLAGIYRQQNKLEKALKVLAAAVAAAKKLKASGETRASLYFYMGEIELQLKRLKEALGFFRQAVEEDPQDSELQARIGDSLVEAGHLEASEEFYRRALELDPELAHVYNKLGIAYRKQGKYDLAISLYRKALVFHPEDEHLLYNIARCLWEMEQYLPAAETLRKALEINPEFTEAQKLLDAVLHKLGFKVRPDGSAPPTP